MCSPGSIEPAPDASASASSRSVAAALIAGCGSSGSSSTITVGNENKADEALAEQERHDELDQHEHDRGGEDAHERPAVQRTARDPAERPAADKLVTKEIITGTGAEAKTGSAVDGQLRGRAVQDRQSVRRLVETQRTVPVHARQGPGHPRLGTGRSGHEGGRTARADHPAPRSDTARKARRPSIPPNETLVFIVDLLSA